MSVIIGARRRGRDLDRALGSLLERSAYPELEVIVVTPQRGEPGDSERARWIVDEGEGFRRARANNLGAAAASGEYLLFLAADTEIVDADWVEQLLLHAALPNVAAVGPMLVRPEGKVAGAGWAIGLRDPAAPMLAGYSADGDGYYGTLPCAREVSSLSADCMLVARPDFEATGGFDEIYAGEYEDHDLLRKLAGRGRKGVYAPRPRVLTHRSDAAAEAAVDIVDRALFVDPGTTTSCAATPTSTPASPARRPTSCPPAGASRSTACACRWDCGEGPR